MLIDDNINIKFKKNWLTYKGLTSQQVEINRQKYGTNVLKPPKRNPWWKLFLEKFEDPVIQILSVAAVIAIAVGMVQGEYIEGVGIIVAILLATILAFVNEYKANQEFDILNRVSDTVAVKVIRDGTFTTVPRQDLVVGDIIYLEQGEEVPADGLILEEIAFYVDQSKLTGESEPVQKTTKDNLETSITEVGTYPAHRVYRSTLVNHGSAYIEITEVGDRTEIGKLAIAVAVVESEEITPLNLQLEKLSKFIGVVGLGFAVLTFAALLIRGFALGEYSLDSRQCYFFALSMVSALIALTPIWLPVIYDGFELAGKDVESPEWLEADGFAPWLQATGTGLLCLGLGVCLSFFLGFDPATAWIPGNLANALLHYFMVAVTIIVVAVPEGLAMSVTLSLAYSMRKMAKDNNLVRQMHACETIGAATVICSDKTGTLTLNQMQVKEVNFPSFNSALPQAREDAKHLIAEAFAVNSTAELETLEKQSSRPIGNVTEGALLLWLDKENLNYATYRKQFDLQQRIPFSTQRKYMATLGTSPLNKEPVLYVKGAPEVILSKCDRILSEDGLKTLDKANKNEISDSLTQYQQKAMRTIGFAYSSNPETINEDNVKSLGYGAYKQARKAEGSSAEVSSAVYEPRPETAP